MKPALPSPKHAPAAPAPPPEARPREPKPRESAEVEFWMLGRKLLGLSLGECESLWELKTGLLLHPLVALFPNFELFFQAKPVGAAASLAEFLQSQAPGPRAGALRVELEPAEADVQQTRHALLALVRLIQNPRAFLSDQMMRFYEVIGSQDFLTQALQGLSFDCEDLPLEAALGSDLRFSQQFLSLQRGDAGARLRLQTAAEDCVRELQFLRKVVLPPQSQANLQGFEEFFEVLVETMERTRLGFVFCRRGVYLSRRVDPARGDEASLQLLSLPRESRKRLSGFFPSIIPLLAQESPAFARRFREFLDSDLPRVEAGGVDLILHSSLADVRQQHKHWLKPSAEAAQKLLGEGGR